MAERVLLTELKESFIESNREDFEQKLEFNYGPRDTLLKSRIVDALSFWKFIELFVRFDYEKSQQEAWSERQDKLSQFIHDPNPLIALVATLESIPTSVWRRILWKANIDFMSFESFLRRIHPEQIVQIRQCYEALYQKREVPQIFSRTERWRKGITLDKIFSETYYYHERYVSKGAMSYNLADLDIGFNAYPKGVANDYMIYEVSPLRFLSKKNHADDFIVNQEFGKYWWFYRTARSNYVFRPDEEVELNTHICPGFWYTFIVHSIFWIFSPAFYLWTINALATWKDYYDWWLIFPILFGLLTPLWFLAALVKFTAILLTKGAVKQWYEKHSKPIGKVAEYLGIGALVTLAAVTIGALTVLFFLAGQYLLGTGGALWCITMTYGAIAYLSHCKEVKKKPKLIFVLPIILTSIAIIGKFIVGYPDLAERIMDFFLTMVFVFWDSVLWFYDILANIAWALGWPGFLTLGTLFVLAIGGNCFFLYLEGQPTERQKRMYTIIDRFTFALGFFIVAGSLGGIGYFVLIIGVSSSYFWGLIWLVLAGAGYATLLFVLSRRAVIADPVTKFVSSRLESHDNQKYNELGQKLNYRAISRNQWLKSLTQEPEWWFYVSRIISINEALFDYEERWIVRWRLNYILSHINEKSFEELQKSYGKIPQLDSPLRFVVVQNILSGMAYREAHKKAIRKHNRSKALQTWGKKVLYVIFFLPIMIFKVLFFIFAFLAKTIEIAKTLKRLYTLFNERCPFVSRPRTLEL